MINRRRVVTGLLQAPMLNGMMCSAVAWPSPDEKCRNKASVIDGTLKPKGCLLHGAVPQSLFSQVRFTYALPNSQLTEGFYRTTAILEKYFGVSPDFRFFDDAGSPNAFATPDVLIGGCNAYGTVLFGSSLIADEMKQFTVWQSSATLIMAHEFGHILQFSKNFLVGNPVQELHADFLGGWICGCMSRDRVGGGIDVSTAASSIFQKGNYDFNNPDFHGTPQMRVKAMKAGFLMGLTASGASDAFEAAINFLKA